MRKTAFLIMLSLIIGFAYGQPWTYDFGTGTSSHTSEASTSFLPTPSSGAGTARVRVGSQGGSFNLQNPGLSSLGSESELRIVAPIGGSVNKFSIYNYTAGKVFYTKFDVLFGSSSGDNVNPGTFYFFQGDGSMFDDNNSFNSEHVFTGIQWSFGANGTITANYRNGSSWVAFSDTPFAQSTVYTVEIYGNNTTTQATYDRASNSYNLAANKQDIWVNGTQIGSGLAKGALANNSNIDSFMFYGENSTGNVANCFLDNFTYSNTLPASGISAPTTQASNINFTNIGQNAMTVNWTNGNGAKRVVLINTANSFTNPADGTDPTANATYGGSGQQVVYNGTGTSVTVSGLTASTTYWFRVYEYNGSGTGTKYLTSTATGNPNSQATSAPSPSITLSTATLTGFTYVFGNGPSTEQSFTVSGANLTANVSISAPTNYEISRTSGSGYASPLSFTPAELATPQTVYVRLKAGRAVGNYNSETITASSTGASNKTVTCSGSVTAQVPSIEEVIVPQYIQGKNGTNNERIPWVCRLKLNYLSPTATYRYYCRFSSGNNDGVEAGVGLFANYEENGSFRRSTDFSFSNAANYAEFTTDSNGSYTGWFMGEPSRNERFTPGSTVYFRVLLNDGEGGTILASKLTSNSPIKVINFGTATDDPKHGTFLYDTNSGSPAKNFVFVYDNEAGTGRPIAGTVVESYGLDLKSITSIFSLYKTDVDGAPGAWGVIIPNHVGSKGFSGIKRIESRDLQTGEIHAFRTSSNGEWGVKDTKNPNGTPINLNGSATLPVELSAFTAALSPHNKVQLTWVTQSETGVQGFYVYRGLENDLSTAILVSNLIEATNTSQTQVYVYEDKELYEAGMYYYWLQSADMDGSSTFFGPVSIQYNATFGPYNPAPPYRTMLKTVYPNPFNPSTRIPFELAKSSNVDIKIYNTRGQLVKSFPLGSKEAGSHHVNWDGKNDRGEAISSGIYFIKMQVGSKTYSTKAVMLK